MSRKSRRKQGSEPAKPVPAKLPGPALPQLSRPAGIPFDPRADSPQRLSILAHASQQIRTFSGPVPPPEILKQYDEIEPGAARRILAQAEVQTAHRIEIEKKSVNSEIRRSNWGLIAGFVVAMTCILGGCLLVYLGHDTAGATIATASVAALVGVFIYGTATRQKERLQRAKMLTGEKPPPEQ